ncbi:MAG: YXWGXW repeat-containing protein [Thermoanaerobaculia bacterium]
MTKRLRTPALLAALVATFPFLVACPPPPRGVVYARFAPPPAEVDVIGVAPGPEHVWIGGHHEWRANAYVWVPGHWAARPHRRARWVAGRWRHNRRGWYWVEGHWR